MDFDIGNGKIWNFKLVNIGIGWTGKYWIYWGYVEIGENGNMWEFRDKGRKFLGEWEDID